MDSSQTLHDFVLNLLTDPEARTAFEVDPEGALHDAGLSDVTAVDVQDVIPLVIDYAPVNGLADLDTQQLRLSALDAGPAGAVQQLQLVTQQLPVLGGPSAAEVNAAAAGALTTGAAGLTSWASASVSPDQVDVSVGADSPGPDAFGASQDLTMSLDAPALDPGAVDLGAAEVTPDESVDMSGAGGLGLGDPLDDVTGTLGGVTGTVDGVAGTLDLDGATGGLTGGLTDRLDADLDHPASSSALTPVDHTVDGAVSTVTGTLDSAGAGDLIGGVTGVTDGATQHLPAGGVVGDVTDLLF